MSKEKKQIKDSKKNKKPKKLSKPQMKTKKGGYITVVCSRTIGGCISNADGDGFKKV